MVTVVRDGILRACRGLFAAPLPNPDREGGASPVSNRADGCTAAPDSVYPKVRPPFFAPPRPLPHSVATRYFLGSANT